MQLLATHQTMPSQQHNCLSTTSSSALQCLTTADTCPATPSSGPSTANSSALHGLPHGVMWYRVTPGLIQAPVLVLPSTLLLCHHGGSCSLPNGPAQLPHSATAKMLVYCLIWNQDSCTLWGEPRWNVHFQLCDRVVLLLFLLCPLLSICCI